MSTRVQFVPILIFRPAPYHPLMQVVLTGGMSTRVQFVPILIFRPAPYHPLTQVVLTWRSGLHCFLQFSFAPFFFPPALAFPRLLIGLLLKPLPRQRLRFIRLRRSMSS